MDWLRSQSTDVLVSVLKPPLCGAVPCVNSPNHLYLDVYLRALSAYFLRPPLT